MMNKKNRQSALFFLALLIAASSSAFASVSAPQITLAPEPPVDPETTTFQATAFAIGSPVPAYYYYEWFVNETAGSPIYADGNDVGVLPATPQTASYMMECGFTPGLCNYGDSIVVRVTAWVNNAGIIETAQSTTAAKLSVLSQAQVNWLAEFELVKNTGRVGASATTSTGADVYYQYEWYLNATKITDPSIVNEGNPIGDSSQPPVIEATFNCMIAGCQEGDVISVVVTAWMEYGGDTYTSSRTDFSVVGNADYAYGTCITEYSYCYGLYPPSLCEQNPICWYWSDYPGPGCFGVEWVGYCNGPNELDTTPVPSGPGGHGLLDTPEKCNGDPVHHCVWYVPPPPKPDLWLNMAPRPASASDVIAVEANTMINSGMFSDSRDFVSLYFEWYLNGNLKKTYGLPLPPGSDKWPDLAVRQTSDPYNTITDSFDCSAYSCSLGDNVSVKVTSWYTPYNQLPWEDGQVNPHVVSTISEEYVIIGGNSPPAKPGAPSIAPNSILPNENVSCVSGCTTAPTDPDGDVVALSFEWNRSGSLSAWGPSIKYDCQLAGCAEGETIRLRARACDTLGACSVSDPSNQVIVVGITIPPSPTAPNITYVILALLIAFSVIALAYMATYIFDSVIK